MADLIKEFNDNVKNYIDESIKIGGQIPCNEESYLLTEGKCIAIYNELIKERIRKKESQDFKQLLEDLKNEYDVYAAIGLKTLLPSAETKEIIEYTKAAILDYQFSKQNMLIKSYFLGYALNELNEIFHNEKIKKEKSWDVFIQEFFKENKLKMKSSTEKNSRKFSRDIGPYHKLLHVKKSYTHRIEKTFTSNIICSRNISA